jgi:hypothetical protein
VNQIRNIFIIALLLLGTFSSTAQCNALGPLLPERVMEAGVSWRSIDRTVGYVPYVGAVSRNMKIEQNDIAVFGRYGVTSSTTFSFELSVTPDELAFKNGTGSLYVVGGALQLGVWTNLDYALSVGFHYASLYWKNDAAGPDVEEQLLEFTLQLQRSWALKDAEGIVWAAPLVSYLTLKEQRPANDAFQEPFDNAGALIGANATFYRHAGVEAQYLWVETSELRMALFYRF